LCLLFFVGKAADYPSHTYDFVVVKWMHIFPMLCAKRKLTGEIVTAYFASKAHGPFKFPDCDDEVILKTGRRTMNHFAHVNTVPQARAVIDATLQMQLGNPSGATTDTNNHNHYLIQRTVEALDYSDNLGEPVWASWDLTAGDVGGSGRNSTYYTDTNLPPNFYRVTTTDYNGVGNIDFNRGHLCSSDDRTDTTTDNKLVFYHVQHHAAVGAEQSGRLGKSRIGLQHVGLGGQRTSHYVRAKRLWHKQDPQRQGLHWLQRLENRRHCAARAAALP
jgi:hypothetical protein